MEFLFDLQEYLFSKPLGELVNDRFLSPFSKNTPTLFIEQIEDIRIIRVANQANNDSGVVIDLSSIKLLVQNDNIIVVGRFSHILNMQRARIALFSDEDKKNELSYYEPYNNLFSLSCRFAEVINQKLYLSLAKISASFLSLDFFIDNILIIRNEHKKR